MTIVHIGLGKTATTSLQKYVFPQIADSNGYNFNDARLKGLAKKINYLFSFRAGDFRI